MSNLISKSSLLILLKISIIIGVATLFVSCGTTRNLTNNENLVPRFFIEANTHESSSNKINRIQLPVSESIVSIKPIPTIPEFDIQSVSVEEGNLGRHLSFQLREEARLSFMQICGEYRGRRLVLVLNQTPVGSWRINDVTETGMINIYVEIPEKNLTSTASQINYTLNHL